MKIEKYLKKGNNNYLIYLDDGRKIKINEDVILKYKLLYKKEIDEFMLNQITSDNNNYDIYNKCVKYISVRLRSKMEIIEFMKRKGVSEELIYETVTKLIKNKLIDDDIYTKAFINDKMKFTTMGPYRIRDELKKQQIDDEIIYKYLDLVTDEFWNEKIDKQINKIIKGNRLKANLRNKVYINLMNLGYPQEMILNKISEYQL